MRILSFGLACVLIASVGFVPLFASAQQDIPDRLVSCSGIDCNFCDLVQLAQNILNFAIYLAVVLAAVAFAYAGVLYLTSSQSPDNIGKAKNMFKSIAFGLLIILGAWLVIDIILQGLLEVDLGSLNAGCRL